MVTGRTIYFVVGALVLCACDSGNVDSDKNMHLNPMEKFEKGGGKISHDTIFDGQLQFADSTEFWKKVVNNPELDTNYRLNTMYKLIKESFKTGMSLSNFFNLVDESGKNKIRDKLLLDRSPVWGDLALLKQGEVYYKCYPFGGLEYLDQFGGRNSWVICLRLSGNDLSDINNKSKEELESIVIKSLKLIGNKWNLIL